MNVSELKRGVLFDREARESLAIAKCTVATSQVDGFHFSTGKSQLQMATRHSRIANHDISAQTRPQYDGSIGEQATAWRRSNIENFNPHGQVPCSLRCIEDFRGLVSVGDLFGHARYARS